MGKLVAAFFLLPCFIHAQGIQQERGQLHGSEGSVGGRDLLESSDESSMRTVAEAHRLRDSTTSPAMRPLALLLLANIPPQAFNSAAVRPSLTAQRSPTAQRSHHLQPMMVTSAQRVKLWAKEEEIGPYITLGRKKDKVINWYGGIVFAVPALFFGLFWYSAMTIVGAVCDQTGWDPKRRVYDWTGRIWNFLVLGLTGNYPRVVTGLENRPKEGQACVICANHASWYDILLAGYTLPATFKFVSAAELAELPGVGKQLYGGKHVLIDRKSRKGQLRAVKDSLEWLSKNVSIFAFPEGTRSRDGKLQRFKGGVFSMAVKAGVPIVPVSIVNAFRPYPPNALLPITRASDMEIHFHPMVETKGRTEEELQKLVREAIVSKLPADHLPDSGAGAGAGPELTTA
mmetsp:Transcript_37760/g.70755  ORF Transcript_37760/g.70755 Transcript_37760/m.70755 type:complete len:400 (-) Transcript_37760:87-1286(-)